MVSAWRTAARRASTFTCKAASKREPLREQILEAAGVSVLMQGGPAFTHVPEVLTALEYLEGTTGS